MAKNQKITAALLTGAMLAAQTAPALAAEDLSGHWASEALSVWQNHGVILGDDLGNLNPDKPITRAEMAVILDRVMEYQVRGENNYTDLDRSWYTEAILGASAAGIIAGYEDGSVKPGANITRQEAVLMFARILALDTEGAPAASYEDRDQIGAWAEEAVNAMTAKGYISGYNNRFRPTDTITRAEVITILNNVFASYIDEAGEYSEDVDGSVVVNSGDVVLRDMDISGDLIIAEGVADGHIELDSVTVDGQVIVRGGGENSVVIKGSSSVAKVALARLDGQLRLSVEGDAQVSGVAVTEQANAVKIEGAVDTVTVEAEGAEVEITGSVQSVAVNGADTALTVAEGAQVGAIAAGAAGASIDIAGSVTSLEVGENGEGAAVSVGKNAQVEKVTTAAADTVLTVAGTVSHITAAQPASGTVIQAESGAKIDMVTTAGADTTVKGEGTVSKVEAAEGATGTTVVTDGTQVENNSDESVTTGNGTIDAGSSGTSSSGDSSSGGSNGDTDHGGTPGGNDDGAGDGEETPGDEETPDGEPGQDGDGEGDAEEEEVQTVTLPGLEDWAEDTFTIEANQAAVIEDDYVIPAGKQLAVAGEGTLTIREGGSLTLADGDAVLHIMTGGAVENQASMDLGDGRLTVEAGAILTGNDQATLTFGSAGSAEGDGALVLGLGDVSGKTFRWQAEEDGLGGKWAAVVQDTTVEELIATAQSAGSYEYDNYEYTSALDVQAEEAAVTVRGEYTTAQFAKGDAMNDMARYLGALYRTEDSAVQSITFDGVAYTWAQQPTLAGSNWVKDPAQAAEDGNTLVSAIVDYYQEHMTSAITLTLKGTGDAEITLTFQFAITDLEM